MKKVKFHTTISSVELYYLYDTHALRVSESKVAISDTHNIPLRAGESTKHPPKIAKFTLEVP